MREVSRYSMTYDVMGLSPSLVLAVHCTEKVEGDVAVARSRVGDEGGTVKNWNLNSNIDNDCLNLYSVYNIARNLHQEKFFSCL